MTARRRRVEPEPDICRDETQVIPLGETGYLLLLDEDEAEKLAAGMCPERVQQKAEQMLGWKKPAADDPFFTRSARTATDILNRVRA